MRRGALGLGFVALLWRWRDVAVSRDYRKLASESSRDRDVASAPNMEATGRH